VEARSDVAGTTGKFITWGDPHVRARQPPGVGWMAV
jgi:hypothetical protein